MRVSFIRSGISASCIVLAVSTVASADLSRYREFQLGASVAAVTAITQNAARDLKTIHSRPALLQQLDWRPRYMTGTPRPDRESIGELMFSFVNDQLFKMSIAYDPARTAGLTNDDMLASLSAVYGAPSAPSLRPRSSSIADALDAPVIIAEWTQADTTLVLQRRRHNESFFLVITSLSLDTMARQAQATAVVLDEREAPAREAALLKKRADDEREAAERARSTNKKVFQP